MPTWPSSTGGGQPYTYVQSGQPSEPAEGETWYDTDANDALVYDGAAWIETTVATHDELGNVSAGQHRTDANIRTTVDGQVDADTVDGQHASQIPRSDGEIQGVVDTGKAPVWIDGSVNLKVSTSSWFSAGTTKTLTVSYPEPVDSTATRVTTGEDGSFDVSSWELLDPNGNVVYSGSGSGTTVSHNGTARIATLSVTTTNNNGAGNTLDTSISMVPKKRI